MKPCRSTMMSSLLVSCVLATTTCLADVSPAHNHPKTTPTATPPATATTANAPAEIGEFIRETGFYQSIRLAGDGEPLLQTKSKYQQIEVYETPYYGKVLVLDGVLQLTERDADAYNEMMAHIPMFQHANPKRVLVIGGGDGYVVSEVLKHESVEHVDHVDLDGTVIDICKDHFSWGKVWEDERVQLHVADGAEFCANAEAGSYDVIIQDSSDPWGEDENGNQIDLPSGVLYSKEHFANLHRLLKPNGILNFQAETIAIPADIKGIKTWREIILDVGFVSARYGSITISSYPTGQLGFLLCEKRAPSADLETSILAKSRRMLESGLATSYYHPPLQSASFILPLWAQRAVYGDADSQ